jgi:mono/diheme cytochrome c family protein
MLVFAAMVSRAWAGGDAGRGAAIFALAGGCGCHSTKDGPVGAGGRALRTPFGTFYATNITPDRATGLGAWSDAEIVQAICDGYARGEGVEAPVMPYYLYSGMSDRDVYDLVAYLRTLPAVRRPNRKHDLRIPLARLAFRLWRFLFAPAPTPSSVAPKTGIERGRYLADHVAICSDCHTPRNLLGVPRGDMYLAGSEEGPDGQPVPNITPDRKTGIGDWDISDMKEVLRFGMLPDFDNVQGLMAEVVDGYGGGPGYSSASEEDLQAIALYLKTIPPIEHEVSAH